MVLLHKRIKDKKVLGLFDTILSAYCKEPGKGVAIGNLISQHLANFYLGAMDHWLKDQLGIKGYLRYMDDFILFGTSKEQMRSHLTDIRGFLRSNLFLELHEKTQINRCRLGIPFLGLRIFPDAIQLDRRSRSRFIRKYVDYEKNYMNGKWSLEKLRRQINGLIGFTMAADSAGFRNMVRKEYGVFSEEV